LIVRAMLDAHELDGRQQHWPLSGLIARFRDLHDALPRTGRLARLPFEDFFAVTLGSRLFARLAAPALAAISPRPAGP
jgi:hypothetical protein